MFIIGRLPIVKMSVTPKLTYRFNTVPIKIPASYCVVAIKPFLKFIWKSKNKNKKTKNIHRIPKCIEGEEPNWRIDATRLQDLV